MNPKTHEEESEFKMEDAKEEFGPDRIKQAIEAVYNKRKFTLTKLDNPAAGEVLEFDFSKCEGTVSESRPARALVPLKQKPGNNALRGLVLGQLKGPCVKDKIL